MIPMTNSSYSEDRISLISLFLVNKKGGLLFGSPTPLEIPSVNGDFYVI